MERLKVGGASSKLTLITSFTCIRNFLTKFKILACEASKLLCLECIKIRIDNFNCLAKICANNKVKPPVSLNHQILMNFLSFLIFDEFFLPAASSESQATSEASAANPPKLP